MGLLTGRLARHSSSLVSLFAGGAAVALWMSNNQGIFCRQPAGYPHDVTVACSNQRALEVPAELGGQEVVPYWQHRFALAFLAGLSVAMATPALLLAWVEGRLVSGRVRGVRCPGYEVLRSQLIWGTRAECRVAALRSVALVAYGLLLQVAAFEMTARHLPGDAFRWFGPGALSAVLREQPADLLGPVHLLFPPAARCQWGETLPTSCALNANRYLPAVYWALWVLMAINLLAHAATILCLLTCLTKPGPRFLALWLEVFPAPVAVDTVWRVSEELDFPQYVNLLLMADVCEERALAGLLRDMERAGIA